MLLLLAAIILGVVCFTVVTAPQAILQTIVALVWATMAIGAIGGIAYDLLR